MTRGSVVSRLLTLGVAIAVLSNVGLAVLSWRSASRHRAAAEATLNDFAGVALDRYNGTVEALLRQALMPAFGMLGYQQLPRPGDGLSDLREMAEVPDALAADPCNCVSVLRAEAWFRINLTDSSAVVIDQARRRLATPPAWLAQVPSRMAGLSAEQFRFAGFVIEEPTCTRMIYATLLRDSLGVARQIYGLSVFTSVVSREVFQRAYDVTRLPPRVLSGETSNSDYVMLRVRAPDGTLLYQSPTEHHSPYADSLELGGRRGELRIAATLNPAFADRLLVGGVPRSPARAILLSLGLTLALLLGIGWLAWRTMELARLRADFTSSITHELRTPLTQIRLSAETLLLRRARSPEARKAALEEIVAETERLQHLVDNVLHFSRAERQLVPLTPTDQALAPLVEDTVHSFVPLADQRGARLVVEVSGQLVVRVDDQALRQVLLNLLDNAVRYGPEGQTIVVSAVEQRGMVQLTVADQGDGIPSGDRERVFRPFVRLESAVESSRTGSGLGLAVVHQLITASGGGVSIEHNEPRGTRINLTLPPGRPRPPVAGRVGAGSGAAAT
jgi:signal transduction histidine kinase